MCVKYQKNLSLSKGIHEDFKEHFLKYIYNSMLVLIPLFALIVLILIGYKKNYYQSALIYALYIHCLMYIIFTLKNLATLIFPNPMSIALFILICYICYSLKVAFSLSWKSSIFKTILLSTVYTIFLIITAIGILLYMFFTRA